MAWNKNKKISLIVVFSIVIIISIIGGIKILGVLRAARLADDYSVMSSLSAAIYNYLSDPACSNIFVEKLKPMPYILNNEEYNTLVSAVISMGLLKETPKGWDKTSTLTDSNKHRYEVEIRQSSINQYEVTVRRNKSSLNDRDSFDYAVTLTGKRGQTNSVLKNPPNTGAGGR